jgi:hypothetical protein
MSEITTTNTEEITQYGRGLDCGTSRIVGMWKEDGQTIVSQSRNSYIEIDDDDGFLESQGQMSLITIGSKKVVLGDNSLKIANWIKSPIKRPMRYGILNPLDDDAYNVIEAIITKVLGAPKYVGESCFVSMPEDTMDNQTKTIAHKSAIGEIINKLGYEFVPINEGYATLLALNPSIVQDGMTLNNTGIAISFGGGQTNACLAFGGKQLVTLSVARGGDSIDEQVASTFADVKPNQVTSFKEKFFSFGKTYTDEELDEFGYKSPERKVYFQKMMHGLDAFYTDLINFVIASFAKKFKEENDGIEDALEVVIAGGTSAPEGFEKKFEEVLISNVNFPVKVSGVRKADKDKILLCTAAGSLIKALHTEKKKNKK